MASSTDYSARFYARPGSRSTPGGYTLLQAGFSEYSTSGGSYEYYGGKDLTRQ